MYKDKNGNEIKNGMTLKHDNGDIEKVIEYQGKLYIDGNKSIFPLSEFKTSEFVIIE